MNELIKVTTNENGEQLTSGRDLHRFLEVATEYKDWFPRMVRYGFVEGVDFSAILSESTGGRPKQDHALILDMAKEISMIQRSEKGKQARQYFIKVEKEYKQFKLPADPMEVLALTFEAQKQTNKNLEAVKIDVDMLKNEIDLSRNQKAQLSRAVRFNCMKAVGGKKARAYTLYYRVAISEHWKEIKDYFEVAAYEEIPKLQFNDAMELVGMWHPSAELALKIKKANTQTELFDEVV
ncbi:antA/AntB antirepressor family protein [Carnobacterium maltaromaticum]|uniref:antA/AntB antirepressor family protein n=1 Tax=Carnobacterium maltaromaticum TaxID=2751 RepID=UPI00054EFA92|nr:antA/AntB antirepressor family protein [Carnobacterium maltaromaticum]KRN62740.1 anti-repressor [Carnobacterium maltaromaticum DSM 20342]